MARTDNAPETQATKALKASRIAFSAHLYAYEEHGGTRVSARELNVPEHHVVKTLIFEDPPETAGELGGGLPQPVEPSTPCFFR